jgi:hypothetical protein
MTKHSHSRLKKACTPCLTSSDVGTDAAIDGVVHRLNALARIATLDFAISVGRLIVETFYAGDIDSWRDRSVKDVFFRKLSRHPDLPMSATALYRSVAIYELSLRLPTDHWTRLSASHLQLVLPLSRPEQERLLQLANTHEWPVRRLRAEIVAQGHATTDPHGSLAERPGKSRWKHTANTTKECIDSVSAMLEDTDSDCDLSPESAVSITDMLSRLQSACAQLERRLRRTLPYATTDPLSPLDWRSASRRDDRPKASGA